MTDSAKVPRAVPSHLAENVKSTERTTTNVVNRAENSDFPKSCI